MRKILALALCLALVVCVVGCKDDSNYGLDLDETETEVVYSLADDFDFTYTEEAAAYKDFTDSITIGFLSTSTSSEKTISGPYAGLLLNRIWKLSEGAAVKGFESKSELSSSINYIKDKDGNVYRFEKNRIVKASEILGDGTALVGEGRLELIEAVWYINAYYNNNQFDGYYRNGKLTVERNTDFYSEVSCTVKDVRLGTHILNADSMHRYTDDNYLILELVSKFDKTVTVEVCSHEDDGSWFLIKHRKIAKTINLKENQPQTVVLKYEASTYRYELAIDVEGSFHRLHFPKTTLQ